MFWLLQAFLTWTDNFLFNPCLMCDRLAAINKYFACSNTLYALVWSEVGHCCIRSFLLGSMGASLSHFGELITWSKFKNIKKYNLIPKDHTLGHSLVKSQLMMSAHRGGIITYPDLFLREYNLIHFGLFVLGSTHGIFVLGSTYVMGQNLKYELL